MERFILEYEPKVKSLFSEADISRYDIVSYMSNITMDFLEDLVSIDNTLTPQKLLATDKYHMLRRFTKDVNMYMPFIKMAEECWKKRK